MGQSWNQIHLKNLLNRYLQLCAVCLHHYSEGITFLWRKEKLERGEISQNVVDKQQQTKSCKVTVGLRSEPCKKWQETKDRRLWQTFVLL